MTAGHQRIRAVKEIGKLIIKYGEWGSVICDENGNILCNSDYGIACNVLNKPLLLYKIENKKIEELLKYLLSDYGKYYFDSLGIKDYNQTYCQMNRLTGAKSLKSTTYENYILPIIEKHHKILDFGAGKCAYTNTLKNEGYNVFMYEPFAEMKKNILLISGKSLILLMKLKRKLKKRFI